MAAQVNGSSVIDRVMGAASIELPEFNAHRLSIERAGKLHASDLIVRYAFDNIGTVLIDDHGEDDLSGPLHVVIIIITMPDQSGGLAHLAYLWRY